MTKLFKLRNRETGEFYLPEPGTNEFIILYDSGYPAKVTQDFYQTIIPMNPRIWEVVWLKAPNPVLGKGQLNALRDNSSLLY